MLDIMLTGVGGQGTVLAAKILAQASQERGWRTRTAETIGMAQRGGSVVSHVRMGNEGEEVFSSMIPYGLVDLIIAFEPAEAARVLPYLAPGGALVTASHGVQPVTAALSADPYQADVMLEKLRRYFAEEPEKLTIVDETELMKKAGSRKVLNTILLAKALQTGQLPLDIDDLKAAVCICVKPAFIDLNLAAIDLALQAE